MLQQRHDSDCRPRTKKRESKENLIRDTRRQIDAYTLKSITDTVKFSVIELEKQAATLSPVEFQHTSNMLPLPLYVLTNVPSLTDQMCRHRSKDPLARYSPLGLNETEYTGSVCLVRLWIHLPAWTSQILMAESKEALFDHLLVSCNNGCHIIISF